MISEKAMYWAAVGLMMLVLGSHFAEKYDRCLSEMATMTAQTVSSSAGRLLALTQARLGMTTGFAGPELAMARVQGRMAAIEAVVARQQAACARMEAQRARIMVMQQMPEMNLERICPRQHLQIEAPRIAVMANDGTI
jgi:hypothetical protein